MPLCAGMYKTYIALFINNGVQKLTMNVIYSHVLLQGWDW